MERRDNIQDQERHHIARGNAATACNKDTAKKCTTEGDTASDSVQTAHTAWRETTPRQFRTHLRHTQPKAQLDKGFHILQRYTLEEATGTEKAHTGREYMLNPEQRFTYQSRHTTGQTSNDSCLEKKTKVQPVGGERQHTRLIEDEWTTQALDRLDKL